MEKEEGNVTTGRKCAPQTEYRTVIEFPPFVAGMEPIRLPYIVFRGSTTIRLTVTDSEGNAVYETFNLVVEHAFAQGLMHWFLWIVMPHPISPVL